MRKLVGATCLLLAAGCVSLENVGFYGGVGQVWVLSSIDSQSVSVRSDMRIGQFGALSGQSACNSWQAKDISVYPWFDVETVTSTLKDCPEREAEQAFYEALKDMTIAEVVGETLILSTVDGREMVFKADTGG